MSANTASRKRPKHLDLLVIRLPLPGIVSIFHRVSGAGLFLMLPLLLWLFQQSLASAETHAALSQALAHPLFKLLLIGLLWAYLHHFCAGIRFLLIDLDKGVDLPMARLTSKLVLAVSLSLTVILGAKLW